MKFAVFDIDGTLIRWQLYHTIVLRLAKAGAMGEGARDEFRDAMMHWKRREDPDSFKAYEATLVERFEKRVQDVAPDLFDKTVEGVVEEYKDQVYTYTRDLLTSLKGRGYMLFAISGSPIEVVRKVADYYSFDDAIGSIYERKGDRFSGRYEVAAHNKKAALERLIAKHQVKIGGSIAVGDSPSDIPMLSMVETPIAFNPDQKLFDAACQNRWPIVIERKNVIYQLKPKDSGYELAKTSRG